MFGNRQKTETEQKMYSLKRMVTELAGLNEDQWGGYAFYHEPLERKFSEEQKKEYTRKACLCGRQEADELRSKYPGQSLKEIVSACGFRLETPDVPVGGGHVIFAQYTEPDEIKIYMDCVKKAEELIGQQGLERFFSRREVENLLLAHELFHGIEYKKRDQIYTRTEKIELWRKPFSNKSRILCLSEMAAMAFAARMVQTSFSPYVLDVFLMYSYNREAACALYEEIMEAAGVREREEISCLQQR